MGRSQDLNRAIERRRTLEAREAADPQLAQRLRELRTWQAGRLAHTYEDLRREARYAPALDFFLTELYGPQDFTRRDRDIERAWGRLERTLPRAALAVLEETLELQTLTAELDQAMAAELAPGLVTAQTYAAAYRRVGRPEARKRQIELIIAIGTGLDRAVHHRLTGLALLAARIPAHATGFGALQSFLERGYAAFRSMGGATHLLETIHGRESRLMEALLACDPDPFGARAPPDALHG
ncbi:MAG TPA: hypothetical protein VMD49_03070 [Steroidobacteraceae bacterium]|nr:hypothetical protein [Steroidobacteraceae bacterium]